MTPSLAAMTPQQRAAWLDAYEAGVIDGIDIGRREIHDEWRNTHEVSAAIARQVAQAGAYDELAKRRGQPERAARQREILHERGIA